MHDGKRHRVVDEEQAHDEGQPRQPEAAAEHQSQHGDDRSEKTRDDPRNGEPVDLPAVRFALLPAALEIFEIEADIGVFS